MFGKGDELFLAHLITRPPDFDQILSVKVSGHAFTDAELGQGVRIISPFALSISNIVHFKLSVESSA